MLITVVPRTTTTTTTSTSATGTSTTSTSAGATTAASWSTTVGPSSTTTASLWAEATGLCLWWCATNSPPPNDLRHHFVRTSGSDRYIKFRNPHLSQWKQHNEPSSASDAVSLPTDACLSICGFQRQLLSEPLSEPGPSVPSTATCPTMVILSRVTVSCQETPGDILPRLTWLIEQDALTGLTEQRVLRALIGLTDRRNRVQFPAPRAPSSDRGPDSYTDGDRCRVAGALHLGTAGH